MRAEIESRLLPIAALFLGKISKASPSIDIGNVPENLGGGAAGEETLRSTIINITVNVLKFMGLIAVIVIIIAGIRMVISQGDQTAIETSKKIVLYAVIGLILILLAGAIVSFVSEIASDS